MKTALLVIAAAASQPPATSFDLECSGTVTTISYYSGQNTEPYSAHYRVDLTSSKWCESQCTVLHPLVEVQAAFLVLEKPGPTGTVKVQNEVDRRDGHQLILATSGSARDEQITMKYDGTCKRLPFSGFPAFETAF